MSPQMFVSMCTMKFFFSFFQEFIRIDPSQTEMVLAMALEKPSVAGLMAPHLVPTMSPQMFVPMYDKLIKTLQGGSPELTFMLLTKVSFEIDPAVQAAIFEKSMQLKG